MTFHRPSHSWLTIACLCFTLNALALTGVAHLRLAHAQHHITPPNHRIPIVGGVANGPPNPGPWLPQFELAVGDSLTVGLFTTSPNTTYPLDVEALEHTHQSPGEIAGVGWTTTDALAALPGVWPTTTGGHSLRPRVALVSRVEVVELGTYDWSLPTASLVTFAVNYRALLRATAAHRQRLVCLSLWRDPASVNRRGERVEQYDAVIRQVCRAEGGTFVDLRAIYARTDAHCPIGVLSWAGRCDGWLPDDVGTMRIAQAIVAALAPRPHEPQPRGPQGRKQEGSA